MDGGKNHIKGEKVMRTADCHRNTFLVPKLIILSLPRFLFQSYLFSPCFSSVLFLSPSYPLFLGHFPLLLSPLPLHHYPLSLFFIKVITSFLSFSFFLCPSLSLSLFFPIPLPHSSLLYISSLKVCFLFSYLIFLSHFLSLPFSLPISLSLPFPHSFLSLFHSLFLSPFLFFLSPIIRLTIRDFNSNVLFLFSLHSALINLIREKGFSKRSSPELWRWGELRDLEGEEQDGTPEGKSPYRVNRKL